MSWRSRRASPGCLRKNIDEVNIDEVLDVARRRHPKLTRYFKTQGRGMEEMGEGDGSGVCGYPSAFTIAGLWSEAGICTTIHLKHRRVKKLSLAFDMGLCPPQLASVGHVFVSHGHLDHSAGIFSHARMRGMGGQGKPAKYYLPRSIVGAVEEVRRGFEKLNGAAIDMELVPMEAGDEVHLGHGCSVKAIEVKHRVESVGYALLEASKGSLKPEFRGKSPSDLRELHDQGVELNEAETEVQVVYTGDTMMSALLDNPLVWKAKMLIIEVTYLSGSTQHALKYEHIHIEDLKSSAHLSRNNTIVICHTSARYSPREVRQHLMDHLPEHLINRIWLAKRNLVSTLSSPVEPLVNNI